MKKNVVISGRMRAVIKLFVGLLMVAVLMIFGLVSCTYKVESYEDWEKIANGSVPGMYDEIALKSDIDFAGKEFRAANVGNLPFDGNGYTLKNISYTSSDSGFILLKTHDGITVSNLKIENLDLNILTEGANVSVFGTQIISLENVSIQGTINAPNAESVGGFIYQYPNPSNGCVFVNCISDLTINGGKVAGGFMAYARTASFENCENKSNVSASNTAGGFIGASTEDAENENAAGLAKREIKMTNCTNSGVITSMGAAAGLVGTGEKCIISDCTNNGEVNGVRGVGGLLGSLKGEISNSTNNAKVSAIASASDNIANIGGIVGVLEEKSSISSCINNGEINNNFYISGGIVANCRGNVIGCINNGVVTGDACVGGIAGVVGDDFDPMMISGKTIVISNCINNKDVRGKLFCGGIVGMADLNKVDDETLNASGYIARYINKGFDAVEYGYNVVNKLIFGEGVSMKRYTDEEIRDFTNSILKLFTRATKLRIEECESKGRISATNFAGGYVGIMLSCTMDGEKFGTNSFTGELDSNGVKSEGFTYVKIADISDIEIDN